MLNVFPAFGACVTWSKYLGGISPLLSQIDEKLVLDLVSFLKSVKELIIFGVALFPDLGTDKWSKLSLCEAEKSLIFESVWISQSHFMCQICGSWFLSNASSSIWVGCLSYKTFLLHFFTETAYPNFLFHMTFCFCFGVSDQLWLHIGKSYFWMALENESEEHRSPSCFIGHLNCRNSGYNFCVCVSV